MCGIVGYIGYRPAQAVLLNSLQRLEYRGYDSCGLALLDHAIESHRSVGRVEDLKHVLTPSPATAGIGHTRWATHGGVTEANAHPHMDCKNNIAVVHNGIIENFQALKSQLLAEGHKFRSETDTEVIAHLIEKHFDGDLERAVGFALAEIQGSYAMAVLCIGCRKLIAARKESPLVVGVGDRENFIASDVAAVLDYTDRAIYLEDGDICTLSEREISISNCGKGVSRKTCPVTWTADQVQKGGYEHFMLKEIHEGPKAIADTMSDRLSLVEPSVILEVEKLRAARGVILTACGSSYHAALLGEYLLARLCRVSARAVISSEFDEVEPVLDKDLIIAITQSGETADVLRALRKAKSAECGTLAIVNVVGSTATRICDNTMFVQAGPEVSVAATKTFMAQMISMYLLALSNSVLDPRTMATLLESMKLLPAKVNEVLLGESQIAAQAARLAKFDDAFFVARGINYPIAMEGALKLKEVSYIHAEAYAAGELKHGSFALLGPRMPVVVLAPPDETYTNIQTSIKEIKARGAPVLAVVDKSDTELEGFADDLIRVPSVHPLLYPVLNTVALQLLAYYAARARGCPIDRPANLAKSVTVA
ncbi:MAG: glutamine--fructose-6-phosphate transaminase (isomerizing) [Chloroflexi bacterium]|nr:glutamine--fructose-6-phosphate transaminase (isomerizing) [Chloroflexota bacterium]